MNNLPIYSPKVASTLVKRGFIIKDLTPDKYDPNKTTFFFERTQELITLLREEFGIFLN